MKVEVDVKRIEQVFEFDAGQQMNFLVLELFGGEVRVPCTEELAVAILSRALGTEQPEAANEPEPEKAPPEVAPPPPTFREERAAPRKLAKLRRENADDDAGIAQG